MIDVAVTPRSLAASARVIFRFAIHSENIISSLLLVIYNDVISRLVILVKTCTMFPELLFVGIDLLKVIPIYSSPWTIWRENMRTIIDGLLFFSSLAMIYAAFIVLAASDDRLWASWVQ